MATSTLDKPLENPAIVRDTRAVADAGPLAGTESTTLSGDGNKLGGAVGVAGMVATTAAWQSEQVAGLGRGIARQGERLNNAAPVLKPVGNVIKAIGQALNKPYAYLETRTAGEIAAEAGKKLPKGVSGAISNATQRAVGIADKPLSRIGAAAEALFTKGPLQRWRDGNPNYVEKLDSKGNRIPNGRLDFFAQEASNATQAAEKARGDALGQLESALKKLEGEKFSGILSVVENAKAHSHLAEIPHADRLGHAAQALRKSSQEFTAAFDALKRQKGPNALTSEELTALKEAKALFLGKNGFLGRGAVSGFVTSMTQSHTALKTAAMNADKLVFWKDLEAGFKNLPKVASRLRGPAALAALVYTGFQAGTLLQTGKSTASSLNALHEIKSDVKDNDKTGIMKEARHQAAGSIIPRALGSLAGMLGFHWIIQQQTATRIKGFNIPVGVLTQVEGPQIGEAFASKNSLTDSYALIKKAQKKNQDVPAGAYMGLLVHASKKVQAMDESNPALLLVARHYAETKTPVGEVMQELASGAFDRRLEEASMKAAALKSQPAAASGHPESAPGRHAEAVQARRNAAVPVMESAAQKPAAAGAKAGSHVARRTAERSDGQIQL